MLIVFALVVCGIAIFASFTPDAIVRRWQRRRDRERERLDAITRIELYAANVKRSAKP